MNIASAMDWYRAMLWTTMEVGAPPILAGLVVGLLLAVFQAATQINDSVIAYAPKAAAAAITMVIAGPYMLSRLVEFTTKVLTAIGTMTVQ